MSPDDVLPSASLASVDPYPVPEGGTLQFTYTRDTTDGFMRGDVSVNFRNGRGAQVVARNVPVMGNSRHVKAMGDYAKIFPEPIAVVKRPDDE